MAELNEQKRRIIGLYNLVATGYDKPAVRFFRLGADHLVKFAGIKAGQSVLDIATGTGAAAIAAAHEVGVNGSVVGIDLARDMLRQAERNVNAAGLTNVDVREGDAEQLPFEDGTFDAVICASAIYFLPDMTAGLREWKRVVKPGGVVAFSGYGDSAFQPLAEKFLDRIRDYDETLLPGERPFPWQRMTGIAQHREILKDAGLENIAVESVQLGYHLQSADEWWDIVWNTGFRTPVGKLPVEELPEFRREHTNEVNSLAKDPGIWLDCLTTFAKGTRAR